MKAHYIINQPYYVIMPYLSNVGKNVYSHSEAGAKTLKVFAFRAGCIARAVLPRSGVMLSSRVGQMML